MSNEPEKHPQVSRTHQLAWEYYCINFPNWTWQQAVDEAKLHRIWLFASFYGRGGTEKAGATD